MRIALFSDVHGNRFALEAARPNAVANPGNLPVGRISPQMLKHSPIGEQEARHLRTARFLR